MDNYSWIDLLSALFQAAAIGILVAAGMLSGAVFLFTFLLFLRMIDASRKTLIL